MDVCRSVLVSSWAREASADDPMIFNNDFLEFKNTENYLVCSTLVCIIRCMTHTCSKK